MDLATTQMAGIQGAGAPDVPRGLLDVAANMISGDYAWPWRRVSIVFAKGGQQRYDTFKWQIQESPTTGLQLQMRPSHWAPPGTLWAWLPAP